MNSWRRSRGESLDAFSCHADGKKKGILFKEELTISVIEGEVN
jgi:hypothetical protein